MLTAPLQRLALAYLTQCRVGDKPYDPVAWFHFSNGARLESIDPYSNLRPYGLHDSFGIMVNYRYIPDELAENHEEFVRTGQTRVSSPLFQEQRTVAALWQPAPAKGRKRGHSAS